MLSLPQLGHLLITFAQLKYDAHQKHASQSKKFILSTSFFLDVCGLIFEGKYLDEVREMVVSAIDIARIEDLYYK